MHVLEMVTDEWHDVVDAGGEVEGPSVEAMEAAVSALDASTRTLVMFMLDGEAHMAVGGGNGQYIVYTTTDNLEFQQLTSGRTGDDVPLCIGGQEGEYAQRLVVDRETALRATRYFAHEGRPDPGLEWTRK